MERLTATCTVTRGMMEHMPEEILKKRVDMMLAQSFVKLIMEENIPKERRVIDLSFDFDRTEEHRVTINVISTEEYEGLLLKIRNLQQELDYFGARGTVDSFYVKK